jgi:hypothetical protein
VEEPTSIPEPKPARVLGALEGPFELPEDLFDPLPEEILEDFYGKDGLETVNRLVREESERQAARRR